MTPEVLHTSHNFQVVRATLESDLAGRREMTEFIVQPRVVIAIPFSNTGNVIMVRHWRPILNQTLLECPGGKVEDGESLEQAIKRELSQEIGRFPSSLRSLGSFFTSVGTSTEQITCFVASGLSEVTPAAQDARRMTVVELPASELPELVVTGLADGKSEIAIRRYLANSNNV